ncbi:MAG: UvrD-helicase domain-containing protein [Phycisphaerales bacterium]
MAIHPADNTDAEISVLLRELVAIGFRPIHPETLKEPRTFEEEVARRLLRLQDLLGQEQYCQRIHRLLLDQILKWEREKAAADAKVVAALREAFATNYLATTEEGMRDILGGASLKIAVDERVRFVREWVTHHRVGSPDLEQAAAIAAVHENVLVTARAGSGKTSTLTARAAFLIKHCGVAPEELLLLVFNRAAADEMKRRLKHMECEVPHAMTFHALAYAIVHPEEALLIDSPDDSQPALSRAFQNVLNDFLDDDRFRVDVQSIMMGHFRADWDRLSRAGLTMSQDEGLQFRRALPSETLRGEYVKSFGEKAIANFLFEHGIAYQYERNHWWGGRNYRPDFTLQLDGQGIVVEYFGLAGDPDYDEQAEAKRSYWQDKAGWHLIELTPHDVTGGGEQLGARLKHQLEARGVPCRRLTDDEIWEQIRERAITRFARMARTFVGRCRTAAIRPHELAQRLAAHKPLSEVESLFLRLATAIFEAYLERLVAEGEEDFDGLLERAAARVEAGDPVFDRKSGRGDLSRIRFIMVDEFQDFSPLFFRLLQAARQHNPSVQVFCVGDDWQAINAFAGATVEYFERFETYMAPAERLAVTSNYRSAPCVVDAGNRVMAGRGVVARAALQHPGEIILADLSVFEPSVTERERYAGVAITPAVRRILARSLERGGTVALLARRNYMPYYLGKEVNAATLDVCSRVWTHGLSDDEKERMTVTTAHKYKGLQADTVVLLDALPRCYPLVHPDWVFTRILGDSVEKLVEDERRLFYVACTRAVRSLILVTDREQSPFLSALGGLCEPIDWQAYPQPSVETTHLIVQVGSQPGLGTTPTFSAKDHLKAAGFQFFKRTWSYWGKSFRKPEATIEPLRAELAAQTWSTECKGLEVRVCDGADVVLAKFWVDAGVWQPRLED